MVPLLILLFIAVPIVELAILLEIGEAIGLWWTLALLIADSILGSLLMRSQGRRAWSRFTEAVRAGRPPAREVIDGALIVLGGALLVTPGFLSDVGGLAFLLPPSRAVIRRVLARRIGKRMVVSMTATGRPQPPPHHDVEGTATDVPRTTPRRLP